MKKFVTAAGLRIYRIPCEVVPEMQAYVYLLLGAAAPMLVDSGSGSETATAQILAGLERVRTEFGEAVRPADIRRVLITHGHWDHVGGLWSLREVMPAAEIVVHSLDAQAVTAPDEQALASIRRRETFLEQAGLDPKRRATLHGFDRFGRRGKPPLEVAMLLSDGMEIDGLRVVHTPGHAPGHVCLTADDLLLCGDHLLDRTLPQIWPEAMIPGTGLKRYLDSLDKANALGEFRLALAGHEQPIERIGRRIELIRQSHQRRLDRVLGILHDTPKPLSVTEITDRMYSSLHGFRAMLALYDVGARLEHLCQNGRVAVDDFAEVPSRPNPVYRYRAV